MYIIERHPAWSMHVTFLAKHNSRIEKRVAVLVSDKFREKTQQTAMRTAVVALPRNRILVPGSTAGFSIKRRKKHCAFADSTKLYCTVFRTT